MSAYDETAVRSFDATAIATRSIRGSVSRSSFRIPRSPWRSRIDGSRSSATSSARAPIRARAARMRSAAAGKPAVMSRGASPRLGWLTRPSLAWAAERRRGRARERRYDLIVSHPIEPGDRRPAAPPLDRAPGERFVADDAAAPPDRGSRTRALAWGAGAAIAGGLVLVALATALAVSVGLVVVAAAVGRVTGLAVRAGAGATYQRAGRSGSVAAALALAAVAVAQLVIWAHARSEGGALGVIDYLAETYGPLVPLQLLAAAIVSWWSGR